MKSNWKAVPEPVPCEHCGQVVHVQSCIAWMKARLDTAVENAIRESHAKVVVNDALEKALTDLVEAQARADKAEAGLASVEEKLSKVTGEEKIQ